MTPHDSESIHRASLVIDSHNDTIVANIRRGNRSLSGEPEARLAPLSGTVRALRDPPSALEETWLGQLDLPKLREGGIDAAFFAVDVTRAWKNHLAYAMDALGFFAADLGALGGEVVVARTAADLPAAKAAGRIAAVLVVENSDVLEGSLNVLRSLYGIGVRSIVLTHNLSTWAAAGNAEASSGGGLTRFGVDLVRAMNELGMLVDVSHISERGFDDVLEVTRRPVIASHSCCAALCHHPRNVTDRQLRDLARNGGVVGITFVPGFLDSDWQPSDWPRRPGVERVLDHVEHAVEIAGIDHVGIGSDFDGGGSALASAAEFPSITAGLAARGYGEPEIRKLLGENFLRLLEAVL